LKDPYNSNKYEEQSDLLLKTKKL